MIKTLLIFAVCVIVLVKLVVIFADKIKFYSTGADSGFSSSEISLLWKLSKLIEIEDPLALYWSIPALNRGITEFISDCQKKDTINDPKNQNFLGKLYEFRTRIDIESSQKKGLESTKYLDKGQKLRIILPGSGVFTSEILNNGKNLIIRTPKQRHVEKIKGENWVGKKISVYLWRKGDANYVFDTVVTNSGMFNANSSIYLAHTNELFRTQKRKSVRAQCNLYANLYFLSDEDNQIDYELIEKEKGYTCLLEDISEDGALIRVGGKGKKDARIKLQFEIGQNLIVMFGMIRAVEYNEKMNQSRLHFECLQIKKEMKNQILSFVYNVLPQDQKDVLEALKMTEEDEQGTSEDAEKDVMELLAVKADSRKSEMEKITAANKRAAIDGDSEDGDEIDETADIAAEDVEEDFANNSSSTAKVVPMVNYDSKETMSHLSLLRE